MNDRWRSKFAWSYSRGETWERCKRRYYYNYIAGWENGPDKDRVWELKKLHALPLFKGRMIHDLIAGALKSGKTPDLAGMVRDLADAFQSIRPEQFVEVVNGGRLDAADMDMAAMDARVQLASFCNAIYPQLSEYTIRDVEMERKFSLDPSTPVTAKIDLRLETFDGAIVLLDWKTGKEDPLEANNSEQITTYILSEVLAGTPRDQVAGELVFLRGGKRYPTDRAEMQLDIQRDEIIESCRAMLAVDSEHDFPASPSRFNCRACNFATICPNRDSR